MEEREITLILRDFLSSRNWQILSVHFPGAQGGLSISVNGKSKSWVPDIIASKNRVVLVVECKPKYSKADVNKLNAMFRYVKVIKKFKQKLGLFDDFIFQKAIGFQSVHFDQKNVPDNFVIFLVKDKNDVAVLFGRNVDSTTLNL